MTILFELVVLKANLETLSNQVAAIIKKVEADQNPSPTTQDDDSGWKLQKDGNEWISFDDLNPLLKDALKVPKSTFENDLYHYKRWTGNHGEQFVTRYKKNSKDSDSDGTT